MSSSSSSSEIPRSHISICNNYKYSSFPNNWREILVGEITTKILNPSGVWADFNILHRGWKIIGSLALQGIIFCVNNIPPKPDPADYLDDFISPTTISNIGCNVIIILAPFANI